MPHFKLLLTFFLVAMMVINAVLQVVLGPAAQVFGALASEVEAVAISLIDSGINGAISGQLDGGQALKNAGIAALEAAAFNAVHVIKADLAIPQTQDISSPTFNPAAALESASLHALVGCAGSALGGQSCASGAAAAGIGDLASNIQTGSQLGQFLVSSLAGGIGAKLGGGDFATGALQGGFGYLFNACLGNGKCWTTPDEANLVDKGLYSAYYKTACANGDSYACFASGVANNNTLNGNLANWWLQFNAQNSNGQQLTDAQLNDIRTQLAQDYAALLPTDPFKAIQPNAENIAAFHWSVFGQYGLPASAFGGTLLGSNFSPLATQFGIGVGSWSVGGWCPNCYVPPKNPIPNNAL